MKRLIALALAFAPTLAFAHDFWIEPSTFRPAPGQEVSAALKVGQKLQGDAMPRMPMLIERFFLRGRNGEHSLDGVIGEDPAGSAIVTESGLQWMGYESNAYPVTLEAKKFEDYLRDEGLERIVELRAKKGQSAAPGRERFYRCAKSLVNATGTAKSTAFDTPLGFTLELIPRANPYALRAGSSLPLALQYRGKPIANVLVVAMNRNEPEKAVRARTDAQGHVALRLSRSGFWLIKAVHMEPAPASASGVDWESWWASLTFELAGSGAK